MNRVLFVSLTWLMAFAVSAADGVSIAVVSTGKDASSESAAVMAGQIAKLGYERNPKYSLIDLEDVLQGGEIASRRRLRSAKADARRCRAAYEAFELADATEACADAVVAFEQSSAELRALEPLLAVLRYQGAAFTLQGKEKAALQSFIRLHILEPGTVLPNDFPETVRDLFERAESQMSEKRRGRMSVYVTPTAAEVWIDGRFRGASPIEIDNLPQGRHLVRVVRDGYLSQGAVATVERRSSETVQVTLRPTAGYADFEEKLGRIRLGSDRAPGQLAQQLKVDQLLHLVVETRGGDVRITGTLTDGVGGAVITEETRTFIKNSARFRSDLELWVAEDFRKDSGAGVGEDLTSDRITNGRRDPVLNFKPRDRPTDGKVVVGWSLVGVGGAGAAMGIGFGIYSLYSWDVYKNEGKIFGAQPIPNQLNPELKNVQNAFFFSSLAADIGWAIFAGGMAVGSTLIYLGNTDDEAIDDVLSIAPISPPVFAGLP